MLDSLTDFFRVKKVKYSDHTIDITVVNRKDKVRGTAKAALEAQQQLEKELQGASEKNVEEVQRVDRREKGNTLAVAYALSTAVATARKISLMYDHDKNLEEISLTTDGINRPHFEEIYLADGEALSESFKHMTTANLEKIKQDLIVKLDSFEKVLDKENSNFCKKFPSKMASCRKVIAQAKQLIACAKSVSAVIASVAVSADVLAQMGLAADPFHTDSTADLFAETLPNQLEKTLKDSTMTPGTDLNHAGSAFQLEQARETLIARLEEYLQERAKLEPVEASGNSLTRSYRPVDRGIFYNKTLQDARIDVAARLLMQLQTMQLSDGKPISNPQWFAVALLEAIKANEQCYKQHARMVDGEGKLTLLLENMREEMVKIYPQNIRCGDSTSANLREQLGLSEFRSEQPCR
ncbi:MULTISPECIES: hypothetical protein [unclassified Legionella]|uniref:hypothetical protein n=1 Tax=unclassified Legionella TaxID=2622702 RepID=UPI0010560186|nr:MULTISPECIES: hypothetical protein [unclassified Legionella]MDI9819355.1 hypothetical protein [Legionella sp. PL877]